MKPVFNVSEICGVISVQLNRAIAVDLVDALGDFDDLEAHLTALRGCLRSAISRIDARKTKHRSSNGAAQTDKHETEKVEV